MIIQIHNRKELLGSVGHNVSLLQLYVVCYIIYMIKLHGLKSLVVVLSDI